MEYILRSASCSKVNIGAIKTTEMASKGLLRRAMMSIGRLPMIIFKATQKAPIAQRRVDVARENHYELLYLPRRW